MRSALGVLDAYPYDGWIRMGLALKGWNGPGAFEIWVDWSRTAENYKDHQDCWRRWQGFRPDSGIDASAVFRAATDAGWSLPRDASLEGQGGQAGVKKQTDEWPKPLPLPKEPPPPPQLKPDVLPYPFNDYASASALDNEASPEAVTVFLLSSIGAVTGTRFCIRPDSRKVLWHEFPVRSAALVMEVSQYKTGVFRAGVGPLEKLQRSYRNQNNQMLLDHENKTGIHSRKRKGVPTTTDYLRRGPWEYQEATLRNQGKARFIDRGNVVTADGEPWIGGNPFPNATTALQLFAGLTLSWGRHDASVYAV